MYHAAFDVPGTTYWAYGAYHPAPPHLVEYPVGMYPYPASMMTPIFDPVYAPPVSQNSPDVVGETEETKDEIESSDAVQSEESKTKLKPRERVVIKVVDPSTGEDLTEKINSKYLEKEKSNDDNRSEHDASNCEDSSERSPAKPKDAWMPKATGCSSERSEPIRPFSRPDEGAVVQVVQPQVWVVAPEVRQKSTKKSGKNMTSEPQSKLPEITCVYNEKREIVELLSDASAVIEEVNAKDEVLLKPSKGSTARNQPCAAATIFSSVQKSAESNSVSVVKPAPTAAVILPKTATWGDKFSKANKPISAATVIKQVATCDPLPARETSSTAKVAKASPSPSPVCAQEQNRPSLVSEAPCEQGFQQAPPVSNEPQSTPPASSTSCADKDKTLSEETELDEDGFQVVKKKDKKIGRKDFSPRVPSSSSDYPLTSRINARAAPGERAPVTSFRGRGRGGVSGTVRGGRAWGGSRNEVVIPSESETEVTINASLQSLQNAEAASQSVSGSSAGSWSSIVRKNPAASPVTPSKPALIRPSWAIIDDSSSEHKSDSKRLAGEKSPIDYFDMPPKSSHQSSTSDRSLSLEKRRDEVTASRNRSPAGSSKDVSFRTSGGSELSPLRKSHRSPQRRDKRRDASPVKLNSLRRGDPPPLRCRSISKSPSPERRTSANRSTYSAGFSRTDAATSSGSSILQSSSSGRPARQLAVVNPMKFDK